MTHKKVVRIVGALHENYDVSKTDKIGLAAHTER